MQLGIFEILDNTAKIEDRREQINYLRKESNSSLHTLLKYALDPTIKWLVGPELPTNAKIDKHNIETIFMAETRRLYLFVEGGNPDLKQHRREQLFIQMIEMLNPGDVEVLRCAINKRLPHANLDYELVSEAFPGLLPPVEKVVLAEAPVAKKKHPGNAASLAAINAKRKADKLARLAKEANEQA